ncbi:hypothetical protein C1H46_019997 [Malus baccata]|uniref:Uncharacterized protein n=1 Tax=Malus baccata TaxID=106549 RepID=A0A540M6L9_MALBA|nr:hypothetical protein C1H46_019997 [Malus baccata]
MNKSETFQERSSEKLPLSKSKMKQPEAFQGRSRMNSSSLARTEEVVGLSNGTFTGATSKAETVQERERNSMGLQGVSGDQNVSA